MRHILLLLPTTSYRNQDFLEAAHTLDVGILSAADYCHQLAPQWGLAPIMSVHFDLPEQAAETILQTIAHRPEVVLAVDDHGLELAALLNERFGLNGNKPASVRRLRDKLAFRELLNAHGYNCPEFHHLPDNADAAALIPKLRFPVVVKARRLSASRGVIRADNALQYLQSVSRVRAIQNKADRDAAALGVIIESFIPGMEYALEGLLENGRLKALALFDKPDPLDGPYFEETLYVTPSRLPRETQDQIADAVQCVCQIAGLSSGPVHAEMRVNSSGIWPLEIAARSIGGLCGRALRHLLGLSVEELILRQALGEPLPAFNPEKSVAVMMIPIPVRGIYQGVRNLELAKKLPGIIDIQITAEQGHIVMPPPEGASYLGFIFARAVNPQEAESVVRTAHRYLQFDIRPEFQVIES
ncbi:MAG TPA: ATP-grasp domain-containing protein [Burkholderiales bacterium]|nr:ATP-grasp domain-containing protein [Burkholderiales bacterium]